MFCTAAVVFEHETSLSKINFLKQNGVHAEKY